MILGIDQSLTSIGLCLLGKKGGIINLSCFTSKHANSKRLADYAAQFTKYLHIYHPKIFALERPAISHGQGASHTGGTMFYIGTVFGILQLLWQQYRKTDPYLIPASTIKLFATGKGNSSKSQMIKCALKEYAVDLEGSGADDIADALFIAKIAYHIQNPKDTPKKEYQRRALENLNENTLFNWQ